SRVIDARPQQFTLPARGIVMSAKLASVLQVQPGEELTVKILEGREREVTVPIVGLAEDFAGVAAYMELHALNRALLEGGQIRRGHVGREHKRWRPFST